MSSYVKIKIILTIFISLLLSYSIYYFFDNYNTDEQIVVAAVDIGERELIKPEMLKVVDISKAAKDKLGGLAAKTIDEVAGNYLAKVDIPQGRPLHLSADVVPIDEGRITEDEFGNPVVDQGISESYTLEGDERLIAIQAEREASLDNRLAKGDLVDVFGTYRTPNDEVIGMLLTQGVVVHDVQKLPEDDETAGDLQMIVLKVDPREAMDIMFMKKLGTIDLMLSSARASYVKSDYRELDIAAVRGNIRSR